MEISNGVKRSSFLGLVLAGGLILSGCALAPMATNTGSQGSATYKISPSLWKSADGGRTWEVKTTLTAKPRVTDVDVLKIAVNPQNGQNAYASLRSGGILKTINGGDSWEPMNFVSDKVYGLALDPNNPNTIYASGVWKGSGKLWKSADGGTNWTELYTSASTGPLIISLAVGRSNSNIVFATTSDSQVIKSEDGGTSWQNVHGDNQPVIKVAFDRGSDETVYLLVTGGTLLRSSDSGKTFQDVSKNFSGAAFSNFNHSFSLLETDLNNGGWLYLAGQGGIVRSKDRGDSWEKIVVLTDPKSFPVSALAVNPKNSQELIYGSAQATYKSDDGGITWIPAQIEINRKVNALVYDQTSPSNIYMGFTK